MQVLEQEPIPVRQINKSAPRDLETIALKCLAKEPQKRYISAAELADDLRRYLGGEPILARRLRPEQRFMSWVKRRPAATVLRGVTAALVLQNALTDLFSITSGLFLIWPAVLFLLIVFLRAKGKPLIISMFFSVALCVFVWIGITALRGYGETPSGRVVPLILSVNNKLGSIRLFIPFLLCIMFGAVFSHKLWISLIKLSVLFGLLFVFYCISFIIPSFINIYYLLFILLLVASPAAVYFGMFARITRFYCGGSLVDTACGAIVGTFLGSLLGDVLVRNNMVDLLLKTQKQSAEKSFEIVGTPLQSLVMYFHMYENTFRYSLHGLIVFGICVVIGTSLGAMLAAVSGRKLFRAQNA
jgi:hypothetical protein